MLSLELVSIHKYFPWTPNSYFHLPTWQAPPTRLTTRHLDMLRTEPPILLTPVLAHLLIVPVSARDTTPTQSRPHPGLVLGSSLSLAPHIIFSNLVAVPLWCPESALLLSTSCKHPMAGWVQHADRTGRKAAGWTHTARPRLSQSLQWVSLFLPVLPSKASPSQQLEGFLVFFFLCFF